MLRPTLNLRCRKKVSREGQDAHAVKLLLLRQTALTQKDKAQQKESTRTPLHNTKYPFIQFSTDSDSHPMFAASSIQTTQTTQSFTMHLRIRRVPTAVSSS